MVVQPDGRIVAVGCAGDNGGNDCGGFALARYNSDGAPDTSFDGDGMVIGPNGNGGAMAVALQPDGKLVMSGVPAPNVRTVLLARYNGNGSLDTTFDGDGLAGGQAGSAADLAVQTDGRIVTAGARSGDFLVARYNADGGLEPTFGAVTTDFGGDYANAAGVVIQPDGKIVAAGYNLGFAMARYLVTGGGEVADLAVSVADTPDPVAAGGNLTYAVTVVNGGPQDASRVELTQALPAGSDWSTGAPLPLARTAHSDVPVPGDYDRDARTDVAIFRPSTSLWGIRSSSTGNAAPQVTFGISTDVPLPLPNAIRRSL